MEVGLRSFCLKHFSDAPTRVPRTGPRCVNAAFTEDSLLKTQVLELCLSLEHHQQMFCRSSLKPFPILSTFPDIRSFLGCSERASLGLLPPISAQTAVLSASPQSHWWVTLNPRTRSGFLSYGFKEFLTLHPWHILQQAFGLAPYEVMMFHICLLIQEPRPRGAATCGQ